MGDEDVFKTITITEEPDKLKEALDVFILVVNQEEQKYVSGIRARDTKNEPSFKPQTVPAKSKNEAGMRDDGTMFNSASSLQGKHMGLGMFEDVTQLLLRSTRNTAKR